VGIQMAVQIEGEVAVTDETTSGCRAAVSLRIWDKRAASYEFKVNSTIFVFKL
jgi:hypothetical protein